MQRLEIVQELRAVEVDVDAAMHVDPVKPWTGAARNENVVPWPRGIRGRHQSTKCLREDRDQRPILFLLQLVCGQVFSSPLRPALLEISEVRRRWIAGDLYRLQCGSRRDESEDWARGVALHQEVDFHRRIAVLLA